MNHRGYLTVKQLSDLSSYFGCPIDDLVNHKELLSSTISTAQDSGPVPGDFLTQD